MKPKFIFQLSVLLFMCLAMNGCSSDDSVSNPDSIIGTWELETVSWVFGGDNVIPNENRDVYIFGTDGRVKVVKNNDYSFFLEEGEYDYYYDKEKQELKINGKQRSCTISNGKMSISGDSDAYTDTTISFIFKKR